MKICILSDSHDNRELLRAGAAEAVARGAEAILHCGDVVAPSTLAELIPLGVPVHAIHGNNTGDLYGLGRISARADNLLHYYGQDAGIGLGGRRIFIVHYPHYARAMASTGEWDLVCCGHDHRAAIEAVPNMAGGETLLVNPGSVAGLDGPPTYALGDLDRMEFELYRVGGEATVAG